MSKWFRSQKCRQKRKTTRQEEVEAKEETVYESVFINLNTYRSHEYSLFLLSKLFTLLCVIPSVLLATSFQIAS